MGKLIINHGELCQCVKIMTVLSQVILHHLFMVFKGRITNFNATECVLFWSVLLRVCATKTIRNLSVSFWEEREPVIKVVAHCGREYPVININMASVACVLSAVSMDFTIFSLAAEVAVQIL